MAKKSAVALEAQQSKEVFGEVKLTRSEIIDYLVNDLNTEIEQELEAVQKELNELKEPKEELCTFLPAKEKVSVSIHHGRHYNNGKDAHVSLGYMIPITELPIKYQNYVEKLNVLTSRQEELRKRACEFHKNKSRVKNEIIKRALQGTDEGKALLDNLENLKLSIKSKLLPE